METPDPRILRGEIRRMASLSVDRKGLRVHVGCVESRLLKDHAEELADAQLVLLAYRKYRDLLFLENEKAVPDCRDQLSCAIAMRFFARKYLSLLA